MLKYIYIILSIYLVVHTGYIYSVHATPTIYSSAPSTYTDISSLANRKNILDIQLQSSVFVDKIINTKIDIGVDRKEPRGQMKGNAITFSLYIKTDGEFAKLCIHELSHILDIYFLVPTADRIDPSSIFYDISWQSADIRKSTTTAADFVSGYAMSSQYEDFAESMTMYIFHNTTFAQRTKNSDILRQKYAYIRTYIMGNILFEKTNFAVSKIPENIWDTTKISISLKKYLNYFKKNI